MIEIESSNAKRDGVAQALRAAAGSLEAYEKDDRFSFRVKVKPRD